MYLRLFIYALIGRLVLYQFHGSRVYHLSFDVETHGSLLAVVVYGNTLAEHTRALALAVVGHLDGALASW